MANMDVHEISKIEITNVAQFIDKRAWSGQNSGGTFRTNAWQITVTNGSNADVAVWLDIKQSRNGIGVGDQTVHYNWIDPGASEMREFKPFYDKDGGTLEIVRMTVKYNGQTHKHKISHSLGKISSNTGSNVCFVATVAFGSEDSEYVNSLRRFRSDYLMKYSIGRRFCRFYYENGIIWAKIIDCSLFGKYIVRCILKTLVFGIRIIFYR